MNCELSRNTVHGYFDGELDAVRTAEFERHIESCTHCRTVLEQMDSLRSRLRQNNLYEHAPDHLRDAIASRLSLNKGEKTGSAASWRRWLLVPAFASAGVLAAFWLALFVVQPHAHTTQLTAELIDAHVRSLQPGHLIDVQSTDQHTVKPWFDGKIDFIPPVADYVEKGFALTGGRLDYVDGHNVAVLVYARNKHIVNLFVWPARSTETASESSGSRMGYNWTLWRSGDMMLCLVSDSAPASLAQLKDLIHP
ncbi:MAG TPA: anti-sigma factor [Terriglobales bacterium]|nr:anti-sigma factor [Terriglobales bacterium]